MKNVMYYCIKNDKLYIMPGYVSDDTPEFIEVFKYDSKVKIYDIDQYVPLDISLENENLRYINILDILNRFNDKIPFDIVSKDCYIDLIIDEMLINDKYCEFIFTQFKSILNILVSKPIIRAVYILINQTVSYCKRREKMLNNKEAKEL